MDENQQFQAQSNLLQEQRLLLYQQNELLKVQQQMLAQKSSEPNPAPKAGETVKTEKTEDGPKKEKKKITGKKWVLIAVVGLAFILGALYFIYDQYTYENTDDAYVGSNSTQLSPMVSGVVTNVFVDENQEVKAGQILARINEKDYQTALQTAEGHLGAVQAQYQDAQDDFKRNTRLLKVGSISKQDFDRTKASFENFKKQVDSAQAQVDQARLNLDYTFVRAPADGQIAKKSVEVGMYASVGTALMGFVPDDVRWVDANFKETQIRDIQPGRPAQITVDAIAGKKFEAVVESVSPATGATFTLLPPDNATGNFTKVTQRVPVRLRFKNLQHADVLRLRDGLSVVVDILKHEPLEAVPTQTKAIFLSQDEHQPPPPLFGPGFQNNEKPLEH
jgi:membrane fusion protein (multidrug efflux system)